MSSQHPELAAWPPVTAADEEALVRLVVPYVRWLHPDLVAYLREDNARCLAEWQQLLLGQGVPPELYLWPGSACAFPGVRRRAGKGTERQQQCLRFDQNGNRMAHKVWELLGSSLRQFKAERAGFELVHLFPHQPTEWQKLLAHGTPSVPELRYGLPPHWRERLGGWQAKLKQAGLPALFSNPANMCFLPGSLVRPTDNASLLRVVLWQQALRLYGPATLLPPGVQEPLTGWLDELPEVAGLRWSQCYHGSPGRLAQLVKERDRQLHQLLTTGPKPLISAAP